MSLPCNLHNEADRHTGILIGAAESVHNKKSLVGELLLGDLLQRIPGFNRGRMVVVFVLIGGPPYGILGIFVHYDEFVFRGAACVDTGHYIYSAKLTHLAYFVTFQAGFCLFFK